MTRNEPALAEHQLKEVNHSRRHMNKYTQSLHQDLFRWLDAALRLEQSR